MISQQVLAGCRVCFDWPKAFPQPVIVRVSNEGIPQVNRSSTGNVSLTIGADLGQEQTAEWLARALLVRYGLLLRNDTSPPLWMINAVIVEGFIQDKPQVRILMFRRLREQNIPALAQIVQTYDRTTDSGWGFIVYRFLESGGLEKLSFKQRLAQFWAHGYDWTQLSLFFESRYSGLNGAELELLWQTFVGESFSSERAVCLSEEESLERLEALATMEVLINQSLELLTAETWYLHRNDQMAQEWFSRTRSELEVLAISIHPYYFNACHSLNKVLLALAEYDLENYRESIRQWNQDLLDAQQLSFETDHLLKKLCP